MNDENACRQCGVREAEHSGVIYNPHLWPMICQECLLSNMSHLRWNEYLILFMTRYRYDRETAYFPLYFPEGARYTVLVHPNEFDFRCRKWRWMLVIREVEAQFRLEEILERTKFDLSTLDLSALRNERRLVQLSGKNFVNISLVLDKQEELELLLS